ncbi:MAG TPA: bifunctional nuclease domain-containing protein [Candidatus Acidoferrales bacterium]|nr:bifunctional nuclease domain-containing protein [Candidatus Acidoferrales bacterium]
MTTRSLRLGAFFVAGAIVLSSCSRSAPSEIEVEVRSIGIDQASHSPVILLQDHEHKLALPIWIGPGEAQAIAVQLEGIAAPRPLTHDLMKTILDGAGVDLQRVVITDLKDSTYLAHIHLRSGRKDLDVDSRPSDAIALAMRFQRPIFVAAALLKGNGAIDLAHSGVGGTVNVAGVTVQNLTDELADYFSLPQGRGVLVAEVDANIGSNLQRGDVILEVDGDEVSGVGDFEKKVHEADHQAQLSVQRGSERLQVALTKKPRR